LRCKLLKRWLFIEIHVRVKIKLIKNLIVEMESSSGDDPYKEPIESITVSRINICFFKFIDNISFI